VTGRQSNVKIKLLLGDGRSVNDTPGDRKNTTLSVIRERAEDATRGERFGIRDNDNSSVIN